MNQSKPNGVEDLSLSLRALYESYGYSQYKMSKFEAYDLYVQNKDFLISDSVITFTDTNGKLMALKPDVTLSIIKNTRDEKQGLQKLYYNENVYRISKGTRAFREILQAGLECMGQIDRCCLVEVLSLACESLLAVSKNAVLDLSHLGIVSAVLDSLCVSKSIRKVILGCIEEKNPHEIRRICAGNGLGETAQNKLCELASLSGEPQSVLKKLEDLLDGEAGAAAFAELKEIVNAFSGSAYEAMLRIDFSVVNDMQYYNGLVFKGFVQGVPHSILSGGQYDRLMQSMNRTDGAVGFAVYLDSVERLLEQSSGFDADILLLYDRDADPKALLSAARRLRSDGSSVLVLPQKNEKLRCRKVLKFENAEVKGVES